MEISSTLVTNTLIHPRLASRRHWLKGLGALIGTGLLTAPTTLLAGPAPTSAPLPASALVGGEEYIGMVKMLSGTAIPQGWALCDGRELAVGQHPALFAMLGASYGGNGHSTFALPDVTEALGMQPAPDGITAASARPGCLIAIKTANAPATPDGTELRLRHHYRPRAHRNA